MMSVLLFISLLSVQQAIYCVSRYQLPVQMSNFSCAEPNANELKQRT